MFTEFSDIRRIAVSEQQIDAIRAVLVSAGEWAPRLASHAIAAFYTRVAMAAIPEIDDNLSRNSMRTVVERYLRAARIPGIDPGDRRIVDRVIEVRNRIRNSEIGVSRQSWSALHFRRRATLLSSQGDRCAVCGTLLTMGGPRGVQPELDHIVPYALGGDADDNIRVLCGACNAAKGNLLTFANSGTISLNYFISGRTPMRRLALCVFERDLSRCTTAGCTSSALERELYVVKIVNEGRVIYDNLRTVCSGCVDPRAQIPFRVGDEISEAEEED